MSLQSQIFQKMTDIRAKSKKTELKKHPIANIFACISKQKCWLGEQKCWLDIKNVGYVCKNVG